MVLSLSKKPKRYIDKLLLNNNMLFNRFGFTYIFKPIERNKLIDFRLIRMYEYFSFDNPLLFKSINKDTLLHNSYFRLHNKKATVCEDSSLLLLI